MRRGIAAALAGASIVVAAGRALAGSPTTNCLVAKHKAAGRKIKNRMNCIARAVARFVPVEPDCVTRAEARFDASFARADEKGPCPGTAANVESLADDCVTTLATDSPSLSLCGSTSLKGEGRAAACELACAAKDLSHPGVLASCHVACDDGLAAALARPESCSHSPTTQDDVHACRDDIVAALASPAGAFLDAF